MSSSTAFTTTSEQGQPIAPAVAAAGVPAPSTVSTVSDAAAGASAAGTTPSVVYQNWEIDWELATHKASHLSFLSCQKSTFSPRFSVLSVSARIAKIDTRRYGAIRFTKNHTFSPYFNYPDIFKHIAEELHP